MKVVEVRSDRHTEDLIKVAVLMHKETAAPILDFMPNQIRKFCRQIQGDFDRDYLNGFLCYNGDLPIGFIVCRACQYLFSTQILAYQELVYVKKEFRGTKAFILLIKAFEEWARLRGAVQVFTGVAVFDPAVAKKTSKLLAKMGYPKVGAYHCRNTVKVQDERHVR